MNECTDYASTSVHVWSDGSVTCAEADGHVLAWRSENGDWVWTFVFSEHDGQTRLISRNRFRLPAAVAYFGMLPMEVGSLVMERKVLLGIKKRAEQLTAADPERPSPALTRASLEQVAPER